MGAVITYMLAIIFALSGAPVVAFVFFAFTCALIALYRAS